MAETRQNKLVRLLAASGAVITLAAGGVTGDYYLNPKIDLGAVKVTEHEYEQVRPALAKRFKEMTKENPLTIEESEMWLKAADKEVRACGGMRLDGSKDLTVQINAVLENGCQ